MSSSRIPPSSSSAEAVYAEARQALDVVGEMIAEARQLLGDGQLVVLDEMEAWTRIACDAMQTLPPPLNHLLRNDLEALLFDLDALETDMVGQFGEQLQREVTPPRAQTVGAAYQAGLKRARSLGVTAPGSPAPSPGTPLPAAFFPGASPEEPQAAPPAASPRAGSPVAPPPPLSGGPETVPAEPVPGGLPGGMPRRRRPAPPPAGSSSGGIDQET